MSKVPDHVIHVVGNEDAKGYCYEIHFADRLGEFYACSDDLEECEERFRKQYKHALKKAAERGARPAAATAAEGEGMPEEEAGEEAGEGAAEKAGKKAGRKAGEGEGKPMKGAVKGSGASDPDAVYCMESRRSKIRVELTQENLPRDMESLADLFFSVIYKQDPDMQPEELAKDRDMFNLMILSTNEAKSMNYLSSDDVKEVCEVLEEGTSSSADRVEMLVGKMKSLADGIYSIRREIQKDMLEKNRILKDEEINALLEGTAGTKFQLMFAVPMFIGIDMSKRRKIFIHKGYVSTTTDMNEEDELNMYHYSMTDLLDSFMAKRRGAPLGRFRGADGKVSDHSICLTINDPDELTYILNQYCPGHTLKDLYATFWVRCLD